MSTFQVVKMHGYREAGTVLETDDWLEAQHAALSTHNGRTPGDQWLSVRGTHPSHEWGPPRDGSPQCVRCGAWNNTSYGSQLPCGYDYGGRSLVAIVEDEMALRAGEQP